MLIPQNIKDTLNENDAATLKKFEEIFKADICCFTGSARWNDKYTDIDIAVFTSKDYLLDQLAIKSDKNNSQGGSLGSIKIGKLNFICLTKEDFVIWNLATSMMDIMPKIDNKKIRHGVFELLRAAIKLSSANK